MFDGEDVEDNEGNLLGYVYPHKEAALALCASCPFLAACAVENRGAVGVIYAGQTPNER